MSTYKGLSKKEFEALPREQQLARMALVRPGFDSKGNALPAEEQDAELLAYVEFFYNMRFPTKCHPDCVGKCTPPARVLCDTYYARYPLIVLKASRSSGKAQPLDSKVLTPNGFVEMGSLIPGDLVVDMHGNAVSVTGVFPQGTKKVFKVSFNDGSSTECCMEHLWWVKGWWDHAEWEVKSLGDLLIAGFRQYEIPIADVPEQKPYKKRFFSAVEYVGEKECHCISVDSPTASYLTDDFIVTHNTALITTIALSKICSQATAVDVLGASERQSNYVMEYINSENPMTVGSWWTAPNAPTALLDPAQSLRSKQVLTNGGRLECLTASPKTVRGRRPTTSLCDEVDEAELSLIKSAQGCPKTDHTNKIKKVMLLASTHQHTDGTFSYYWNMASERNKEASIKAGKPTVVIPTYQYCYKDVLISNGGFLSDEEMEETRLVTPEDMWEAEYENGEPNFTGRLFKQWQLEFLFDKHMLGQEAEETKFSGAEDELIEIPMGKLFQNKTVEIHGHIKRFRTAHRTQDHLEFNYGADFANDVDWSVYNRLVTNVLRPQDPTYVQGWYRTGRKDTWKEIVESYNDFCNEHPGMGQHDETGNKAVNDYIDCDSEGFTFSKKTKKPLLDALVVAIQNRRLKGPFIDWAYKEFKFLTREHLTGKKHLPDSVASLALAWHSVQESLGEETDGKIPVGFVGA